MKKNCIRTVHAGCIVIFLRNLLQTSQKDNHRGAELPHGKQNECPKREFWVGDPTGEVGETDSSQQDIYQAVFLKQLPPQHRDSHRAAKKGWDIVHGPIKRHPPQFLVHQQSYGEGKDKF
jgi:hypothetical protein